MTISRAVYGSLLLSLLAVTGCKGNATDGVPVANQKANKAGDATASGGDLGGAQAGDPKKDQPAAADTTQTVTTPTTTVDTTATNTTTTTGTTVPDKYQHYTNPTSLELADPTQVKLLNSLKEGIVSINGHQLAQLLPPTKTMVLTKLYDDIDDNQMYTLRIQTESGVFAMGTFQASDVDDGGWRASVEKDASGQVIIKQNAGGGGGGGRNQQFQNFQ